MDKWLKTHFDNVSSVALDYLPVTLPKIRIL